MKRFFFLAFGIILLGTLQLGAREVYDISRNWKFFSYNERDSVTVNFPHTWNEDALSGRRDYYRGLGNYLKYVDIKPQWRHKRLFVKFYGANSVTDLMINGRLVNEHRGGSNAFVFEITDYIDFNNKNLFWVVVNNASRIDVLPTAGRENSYGGVFREAELIVTDAITIGLDPYGSDGLMFRATDITREKAQGAVNVKLNSTLSRNVTLDMTIANAMGKVVFSNSVKPRAEIGITEVSIPFEMDEPILWDGMEIPYLYDVTVKLTDNKSTDEVSIRTGVRYCSVDANSGFHLNGRPYPLRAVVLYRDRAAYGPVSYVQHLVDDIDLICEMGANAIRVAGGAHHPDFYRLCDERGLIVLNDSPFSGAVTLDSKGFYDIQDFRDNAKQQLKELIYQRYNNPSVLIWGIFVEPELRGDDPIPFIRELNSIAKTLDPSRLTAGISNRDGEVNTITDLMLWNHTFGWVEGNPEDIGIWQEQIHSDPVWRKTKSAVGWRAGGSVYHQSSELKRVRVYSNWHPENWQAHVHEVYLRLLNDDKKFWGLFVGNMFDYGSVNYRWGATRGINDCGLVTFDRQVRKDAFYLFKANWNKAQKFVYIAGNRNNVRSESKQTIRVYSNIKEVVLTVNGVSYGSVKGNSGIFVWNNVQMRPGDNTVEATGDLFFVDKTVIKIEPGLSVR